MLSLEHYNEEIARLVSSLQIETGKPYIQSVFSTFFARQWEKSVTVLVFGKYFDLRDPVSSAFLKCLPTGPWLGLNTRSASHLIFQKP